MLCTHLREESLWGLSIWTIIPRSSRFAFEMPCSSSHLRTACSGEDEWNVWSPLTPAESAWKNALLCSSDCISPSITRSGDRCSIFVISADFVRCASPPLSKGSTRSFIWWYPRSSRSLVSTASSMYILLSLGSSASSSAFSSVVFPVPVSPTIVTLTPASRDARRNAAASTESTSIPTRSRRVRTFEVSLRTSRENPLTARGSRSSETRSLVPKTSNSFLSEGLA